jgi:hypothetical protein
MTPPRLRPGHSYPLGATWDGAGVNFAPFSENATGVELCPFDEQWRLYAETAMLLAKVGERRRIALELGQPTNVLGRRPALVACWVTTLMGEILPTIPRPPRQEYLVLYGRDAAGAKALRDLDEVLGDGTSEA